MTKRLFKNECFDIGAAAMIPSILFVLLPGRQSECLRSIKSSTRRHLILGVPDPELKRVVENVEK
jgi:hypothetical protein